MNKLALSFSIILLLLILYRPTITYVPLKMQY